MSNPFLRNHASVATTVIHKLLKISTRGKSVKTELPFTSPPTAYSSCSGLSCRSVQLPDCLAGSLFLVCFSQHIFLRQLLTTPSPAIPERTQFDLDFPSISSHVSFLPSPFNSLFLPLFSPPHLFLGRVLIFASVPPTPQYLFCPPLVPRFRLSPTNRDCVTSWLEPSSFG